MKIKVAVALTVCYATGTYAWTANDKQDSMTGKTEYAVFVKSKEAVDLRFPYGETIARLHVRNHPRFGKAVIFEATSGQIPCHSYSPCRVTVRIDDRQPVVFTGSNPSDGSSNVVFINGFEKVSKLLESGNLARIEIEFYQNGLQRFTFNITDYSPAMLRPPKK